MLFSSCNAPIEQTIYLKKSLLSAGAVNTIKLVPMSTAQLLTTQLRFHD